MSFTIRSALVAGAIVWTAWLALQPFQSGGFYDLNVYLRAVEVSLDGGNAYTDLVGLRFVYAPAVLSVFVALEDWLAPVLFAIMAASVLTLLHSRMRIFFWGAVAGSAIYFTFPPSALFAFKTGNVSAPLHLILIFAFLVRNRSSLVPFAILVVMAASVKPFFLVYALLPALVAGIGFASTSFFALTTGAVLLGFVLQAVVLPDSFEAFLSSLQEQTLFNDGTGAPADPGRSPFGIIKNFLESDGPIAIALHVIVTVVWAGALISVAHRLRERFMSLDEADTFVVCVAVVAVNLLNPRLLVYDWFIIEAAAVGALLILARSGVDSAQFAVWPAISALMFAVVLAQAVVFAGDRQIFGEWLLYSLFFYWLAFYPAALFLTARLCMLWWRDRRRSIVA